ncbi:MAG: hypothetical protein WC924_00300 [Candidatus Gracilibacteria bacterium]
MDSLPIINKSYELYKHFTEANEHMTKRWRSTLGESIVDVRILIIRIEIHHAHIGTILSTEVIQNMSSAAAKKTCAKRIAFSASFEANLRSNLRGY